MGIRYLEILVDSRPTKKDSEGGKSIRRKDYFIVISIPCFRMAHLMHSLEREVTRGVE